MKSMHKNQTLELVELPKGKGLYGVSGRIRRKK